MHAKNIKNKNKDGNKTNKNKEGGGITILTLLHCYNIQLFYKNKLTKYVK